MSSLSRVLNVEEMCLVLAVVVALPIWWRSIRVRGVGRINGGGLRVVGFVFVCLASGVWMSPICGMSTVRVIWSPYSGV